MQLTTPPIMIGRATDAFRSIDVPFGNIVNTLRRKQLIVAGNATTKPPNSSPPLYDRPSVDACTNIKYKQIKIIIAVETCAACWPPSHDHRDIIVVGEIYVNP